MPLKQAATNAEHYQEVADAINTIKAHPAFQNVVDQDALDIGSGKRGGTTVLTSVELVRILTSVELVRSFTQVRPVLMDMRQSVQA